MKKNARRAGIVLMVLVMALAFAGCGSSSNVKQTANAWLTNGDVEASVTIELTGGWSVEFARGAAYIYDTEITEGLESTALLNMLDKEVYDEYMDAAKKSDSLKEIEGATVYTNDSAETAYLFSPGTGAYFMLTVKEGVEGDPVFARVQAEVEQGEGAIYAGTYGYSGTDLQELAVYQYLTDEITKNFDKADATVPVVTIVDKDESNPDDILVKGDFWIWNYKIDGDTLKEVSGGAFPGCMHLAKQEDETYKVTAFDVVEDGSSYDSSAKEIFGDKYDKFVSVSGDDKAREEQLYQNITTYVNANEIPCTKYQSTSGDVTDLHL